MDKIDSMQKMKNIIKKGLFNYLIIVLLLLLYKTSIARNYYVDPSSTVTIANGSLTNPWKTISQVNAGTVGLLPGDSVLFKRGQVLSGRLIVYASGTALAPIVYSAYGTGNMPELTYTASDIITITNRQYIVIDGLKIIDKTMSLTDHTIIAKISYAITLQNSPFCTIKNCEITLVGVAIAVQEGSDFTTIASNYLHNLRAVRNTVGGDDDYGANAMVIGTSNNTISNNRMEECWATSYDYGYDGGAVEFFGSTISDNKIIYNTALNCNGFIEIGSNTYGIATNNLVAYNKIINCGQTALFHNKQDDFAIRTDNLKIFNNVIVETKKQFSTVSSLFWYSDPTKIDVVILKNNIIWLTTGENVVNNNQDTLKMTHTNNIYKLRNGTLGVTLGATELLATNTTPLFRDTTGSPENWDYRLLPNSVAIDFGIDVGLTKDYVGYPILNKPDVGIFESIPIRITKFYVDPSSLNSIADGSFASPWKTISQVNIGTQNLQPGDTVFFKKGQVFNGRLVVNSSGTQQLPIVYTSYGIGDIPIFSNTIKTEELIYINSKQYIHIDGLKFMDQSMNETNHAIIANIEYGIILENAPNCTIRNCEITKVGIGIATKGTSNNTLIENNNIYNLRAIVNTIGGADDYGANALVIGSSNNLIQRNRFEGCWANSYDYGFLGGTIELFNTSINDNKILYNTALNCNGFLEIGSQSIGQAINNLIAYNKIINCGQTAKFHNKVNESFINTTNTMFYNNVIIENKIQFTKASAMFWYADPTIADVVVLKNNIIWLTTGENVVNNNFDTAKMVHTNNLFKLRNSLLGVNLHPTELLLENIPIFVDTLGDAENWDYRLIEGSLGINLGTDLGFTKDYVGNNIIAQPDVGIIEYINPVITRLPKKFYANSSSTSTIEDGSIVNPWKSISALNNATIEMVPGDTVFLKSGAVFNGTINVSGSGNILNPIVYTSYTEGPRPIISTDGEDIIIVRNRQYITINGLALTDRTMDPLNHSIESKIDYGVILINSPNCTVSNCSISLVGIGIATQDGSNFTNIIGNTINNLRAIRNTVGGEDDYGANGLVISSSSNQIKQNIIYDCWATSFDYGFLGGAIELFNTNVNNNYIMYNSVYNCSGFLEIGGVSSGSAINNLFAYNKIVNCGQTALFHNKIDINYINTNNTRIFNNVIIENKQQYNSAINMFSYDDPTLSDIVILKNNIIWLTTGQNFVGDNIDTAKMVHTNNLFYLKNGIIGINLSPSERLFTNAIKLFEDTLGNAEDWNYRLIPYSPGINFGVDIGLKKDFVGNPILGKPDAGIYEYQFIDIIPKLEATAVAGTILCYGGSSTIQVSATGGISPYIGTGTFIRTSGNYQFIVTDAIGTKDTVMITLSQPDSLKVAVGYSIVTSYNTTTSIFVTVSGGTPPYQYQIDDGLFQSSNVFTNKTAGIYKITVKDANGCTKSVVVNLLVTAITENPDRRLVISVAPNPSSSSFTVNVIKYRGSFVAMNLRVYNSFGQIVYSAQGLSNVTYSFGSNFIPGNYVLVATVDGTVQAVKLVKM